MPLKTLLIFVKNLVPGQTKTRLAKSIGNQRALQVYQRLVEHTHDVALSLPVNKEVWYSDEVEKEDVWNHGGFTKRVQKGDDLGHKMAYAFKTSFEKGASNVVIIGSDSAEIDAEIIEEAFEKLAENDVVVGPARDGGYYLLGMNKFHPQLFEGVEWSTDKVLHSTLETVEQLGLTYTKLKPLNDVDTIEDWLEVKDQLLKRPIKDV